MDVGDSEFFFLPSNMPDEPDNKTDDFNVKLGSSVQLRGKYRVGVVKAILPKKWFNITDGSDGFELKFDIGHHISGYKYVEGHDPPVPVTIPKPPKLFGTWNDEDGIKVEDYVNWFNQHIPVALDGKIKMKIRDTVPETEIKKRKIGVRMVLIPSNSTVTFKGPAEFWQEFSFDESRMNISYMHPNLQAASYVKAEEAKFEYSAFFSNEIPLYEYLHTEPVFCQIPHGRYENKAELLTLLNSKAPPPTGPPFDMTPDFNFTLETGNKVKLRLGRHTLIRLTPNLAQILGGFETDWLEKNTTYTSGNEMNLENDNISAFLLYSNIVCYSHLGGILAPVLGVLLPEKGDQSSTDCWHYEPPLVHYIDVSTNFFTNISIKVRSQSGGKVEFIGGMSLIKLHMIKVAD
jgi:hypothetical protein